MRTVVDVLIVFGLLLATAGAYLQFGLGWALIIAGALMTGAALYMARIHAPVHS